MGLFNKFISQTRKPEGFLGKMMIHNMNSGHAKMADWAISFLPADGVLNALEIGCGGGRNAGALLKKYPSVHISAIDYSPLSVAKAAEFNKEAIEAGRCTVKQGDASNLDFAEQSFDLATAFETIYFWPELEKCFAGVARVLKTGGRFMIVNECNGEDSAGEFWEKRIEGMKVYTPSQVEEMLKSTGFSKVTVHCHEKKPWFAVIAEK